MTIMTKMTTATHLNRSKHHQPIHEKSWCTPSSYIVHQLSSFLSILVHLHQATPQNCGSSTRRNISSGRSRWRASRATWWFEHCDLPNPSVGCASNQQKWGKTKVNQPILGSNMFESLKYQIVRYPPVNYPGNGKVPYPRCRSPAWCCIVRIKWLPKDTKGYRLDKKWWRRWRFLSNTLALSSFHLSLDSTSFIPKQPLPDLRELLHVPQKSYHSSVLLSSPPLVKTSAFTRKKKTNFPTVDLTMSHLKELEWQTGQVRLAHPISSQNPSASDPRSRAQGESKGTMPGLGCWFLLPQEFQQMKCSKRRPPIVLTSDPRCHLVLSWLIKL